MPDTKAVFHHLNNDGGVLTAPSDMRLDIARGIVPGQTPVLKFGRNSTTEAGDDIWSAGGVYAPPTQTRTHNIASTSAQDAGTVQESGTITTAGASTIIDTAATFVTSSVSVGDIVLNDTIQDHSLVLSIDSETQLTIITMHHGVSNEIGDSYRIVATAGTGAAVVHIKNGLDANFAEQTEFIVLNGTSNVATTNTFLRINRFHIHGVGSGNVNAGVISATAQTDTTVTAEIPTGLGQTLMAHYTVPAGKKAYITSIYATINKNGGTAPSVDIGLYEQLWAGNVTGGGDGRFIHGYWGVTPESSGEIKNYNPYKFISEYSDVWLRAEQVAGSTPDISAGFDLILVDN